MNDDYYDIITLDIPTSKEIKRGIQILNKICSTTNKRKDVNIEYSPVSNDIDNIFYNIQLNDIELNVIKVDIVYTLFFLTCKYIPYDLTEKYKQYKKMKKMNKCCGCF